MRHPTEGTLRRLVDESDGVTDTDREHVSGCPACLSGLAAAQQDAEVAGAALGAEVSTDVDTGWRRLSRAIAGDGRQRVAASGPARRRRAVLRSPVIAAVGVLAVLTGAGAAAAADWLPIFRTERIAPISISEDDLVKL